ncbi:NAD-dependent deacetylase [Pseudonocardia sp. WMMC193]|uniref:SIR2 family NAD-dependent protein deacylase n=1 Tax=Pseudonocardia sp. WMMC193 TaxID=2911965 RepID=UPI0035AB6D35
MSLDTAAAHLRAAGALLICAGAGMGVDSGLPDFRGTEGFWRAYPPYERLGLRFEELADPVHFADDPALAWGFYGHRLALYRKTVPHAGFEILRRWAERYPTWVFTSNVDGQFQVAGFDRVAEVHGSIHHLQCLQGCGQEIWPAGEVPEIDPETMRAVGPLPACPSCGALARPNILMFGDWEWDPARSGPDLQRLHEWIRGHRRELAVVEIGAGTAVPTVRREAELASAASGRLVRINVREPQVRDPRGVGIAQGAESTLRELDTLL